MRIGLYTRFILWINEWSAEKLLDLYDWDNDEYYEDCD